MLNPDSRQSLVEALKPPPDFTLDLAVGTSFSLHLDAALTPAAAFAVQSVTADDEGQDHLEPLALLDALRRNSERISIFFQSGQVPVSRGRKLLAFFEESLIPVTAPLGGVFHPKVWVVRYTSASGGITYRTLCASRNLTYDRAWDTILRLDSTDDGSPGVKPAGLAAFVAALPGCAVSPLATKRRGEILALAGELKHVNWSIPEGFEEGEFLPIGMNGPSPFPVTNDATRIAVVSPFLSSGFIDAMGAGSQRTVLVSSPQSIDDCAAAAVRTFAEDVWVLNPDAVPDHLSAEEPHSDTTPNDPSIPFSGLHAKLFVSEIGARTEVITGSANATTAAFQKNVEFAVRLVGPTKLFGVEKLLAEPSKDVRTLTSFLQQHRPSADGAESSGGMSLLDELRQTVASVPIEARAIAADEDGQFELSFEGFEPLEDLPEDLEWQAWPLSLQEQSSAVVDPSAPGPIEFTTSFEAISPFLACSLSSGGETTRFVLCAELVEAPDDRQRRLLRMILENSERFIRYLLMLLADPHSDQFSQLDLVASFDREDRADSRVPFDTVPLLEVMLRALADDPARLADAERLISDLRDLASEDPEFADDAMIAELEAIWHPIWSMAAELQA